VRTLLIAAILLLSADAFAGLAQRGVRLWNLSEPIEVCFLHMDDLLKPKNTIPELHASDVKKMKGVVDRVAEGWIREIIQQEYVQGMAIPFSGWKDCAELGRLPPVVVLVLSGTRMKTSSESVSIGKRLKLGNVILINSHSNNVKDPESKKIITQFNAIHEFGHLLGLRHEHERAEAKKDINCVFMNKMGAYGKVHFNKTTPTDTVTIGEYDSNSVMNYCFAQAVIFWGPTLTVDKAFKKTIAVDDVTGRFTLNIEPIRMIDWDLVSKTEKENGTFELRYKAKLSQGDRCALAELYHLPEPN